MHVTTHSTAAASRPAIARLQGVHRRYGQVVALDGVNLHLRAGELLALLGANGAGKSTAIGLLLGLLRADAGEVTLLGGDPNQIETRRGIGVMLQSAALPETSTVRELLELTRSYYQAPHALQDCTRIAGIGDLLARRYGKLSGGQQRRVQFALAICGAPRALFLDEPTTGLDVQARQALWQAIRALVAEGCAILLTTHYLEEAEALADRVLVLARGKVVAEGDVTQIRARVAHRRVRCETTLHADVIATWPQVRSVQRDGTRIEIVADTAEDVVRRLLQADPQLSALEVSRAGLGEAFIEITRAADAERENA